MATRKAKPKPVEGTWLPTPKEGSGPDRKAVDIDSALHQRCKDLAKQQGVSLREIVEAAISHSIGALETPADA